MPQLLVRSRLPTSDHTRRQVTKLTLSKFSTVSTGFDTGSKAACNHRGSESCLSPNHQVATFALPIGINPKRSVRIRSIVLKKSARDIFVHGSAGIIRSRPALWINRFQPQYLKHGSFAAFKVTDFFNTIAHKRTVRVRASAST